MKLASPKTPAPNPPRAWRQATSLSPAIFNIRLRSLARGNLIVLVSLVAATLISRAPHLRATPLLLLPTFGCLLGTADTVRCMRTRWSFYHGGVVLCVYMDLLAITLVLFFLLYPYLLFFTSTH
jgi:hypothetical protein